MDRYVTGAMIRRTREERKMTQAELGERIGVSDKAVSRWETGRGYPDITLVEPLASALGISVAELLSGCGVANRNRSFDLRRTQFHVCPICGNILTGTGGAAVSCCGVTLPPLEAEAPDAEHLPTLTPVEDEYCLEFSHPMTRDHFISFAASLSDDRCEVVKLYPEGAAAVRFQARNVWKLCFYCNRHGLFELRLRELLKQSPDSIMDSDPIPV